MTVPCQHSHQVTGHDVYSSMKKYCKDACMYMLLPYM